MQSYLMLSSKKLNKFRERKNKCKIKQKRKEVKKEEEKNDVLIRNKKI